MTAIQTSHTKMSVPVSLGSSILGRVKHNLCAACFSDIQNVSVRLHGNALVLEGIVSSYYHKQVAQSIVREIDGVRNVVNNLRVVYPVSPDGETR